MLASKLIMVSIQLVKLRKEARSIANMPLPRALVTIQAVPKLAGPEPNTRQQLWLVPSAYRTQWVCPLDSIMGLTAVAEKIHYPSPVSLGCKKWFLQHHAKIFAWWEKFFAAQEFLPSLSKLISLYNISYRKCLKKL